jgi:hypothetical protein
VVVVVVVVVGLRRATRRINRIKPFFSSQNCDVFYKRTLEMGGGRGGVDQASTWLKQVKYFAFFLSFFTQSCVALAREEKKTSEQ